VSHVQIVSPRPNPAAGSATYFRKCSYVGYDILKSYSGLAISLDVARMKQVSFKVMGSALELEIARLMVDALNLGDIKPEAIDPLAPLFREGLGLDSIDALELSLAISRRYGVQLRSDDQDNLRIFANLRSLSQYVAQQIADRR
jgi:acyl carrier protein